MPPPELPPEPPRPPRELPLRERVELPRFAVPLEREDVPEREDADLLVPEERLAPEADALVDPDLRAPLADLVPLLREDDEAAFVLREELPVERFAPDELLREPADFVPLLERLVPLLERAELLRDDEEPELPPLFPLSLDHLPPMTR